MAIKQLSPKSKKILSVTLNVLTYVFFAICLFALVLSVTAKKDADGAVNIFGTQMRVVLSNSMEKCDETPVDEYEIKSIPIRSMVFIELVPKDKEEAQAWYASLKKGDVLTFKYVYARQETITHRITEDPTPIEGGYIIHLAGDNKSSDANTLTQTINTAVESHNYVIGKVTGQSYLLGWFTTVVKSSVGIICIIIIPCLIIAGVEIYRLVTALTESKRKQERAKQQKRDEEFEEMKRKLALLEKQAQSQEPKEADEEDKE